MLHHLGGASTQFANIANCNCNSKRLALKKSLEPSHGVIQLLKKNFYRVLILPLFSIPCVSSSEYFFVLVNDLYIGDPLKTNKHRTYAYFSKTLLMTTLNSGRINLFPSSMYRSYNRIPQSKSMHIMPRGHIVTDQSTFSYFVTLILGYPKAPRLIWVRSLIGLFVLRSNLVSKVYQHRPRNGGILVEAV